MSTDHSTSPRDDGIILTRTSDPKQSGASSQLTGCRRLAALHDVEVVAEVDDDGVSGDDLQREGILETLAVLQKAHRAGRPIGWLITDQSDRLSPRRLHRHVGGAGQDAPARRPQGRDAGTIFDLHNALDRHAAADRGRPQEQPVPQRPRPPRPQRHAGRRRARLLDGAEAAPRLQGRSARPATTAGGGGSPAGWPSTRRQRRSSATCSAATSTARASATCPGG